MLKLITDTHIAKQIAIQLRANGVDVVRLEEVAALGNDARDVDILTWATANKRAVLSLDDDFEKLHYQWMMDGKIHNGIFFGRYPLQGQKGIGKIVVFISNYAADVFDMALIENDLIEMK